MRYYKGYKNNLYLIPNDSIAKKTTINYFNKKSSTISDSIVENTQAIDTLVKNNDSISDIKLTYNRNTIPYNIKKNLFGVKANAVDKVLKTIVSLGSVSTLKSNNHFRAKKIESKPLAIIGIVLTVIGIYLIITISSLTMLGVGIALTVFGGVMGIYSFKRKKNWLSIMSLVIGIIGFLVSLFFILFILMLMLFVFK